MIINGRLDFYNCKDLKDISKIIKVNGSLILPGLNTDSSIKVHPNFTVENLYHTALDQNLKNYSFPSIKVLNELSLDDSPLKKIPDGLDLSSLKILTISWSNIKTIPDNLDNLKELNAQGNKELSNLPNNITKYKSLNISNSKIKELPKNLEVEKDLSISSTEIKELPDNLKIKGTLNIFNSKITELPKGLEIGKNLLLGSTEKDVMQWLKYFPKDLKVGGYINISNCSDLEYVPDNLKVFPSMGNCKNLKSIPKNILMDFKIVEEVMRDTYFMDCFDLSNCHSIKNLGLIRKVNLWIDLTNCYSLETFSQLENVKGAIKAENCKNLKYILKLKFVGGSLNLKNCSSLKTLGQLENVKGDLNLRGCDNLTLLPENLKVTGEITVSVNNKIRNLNKFKDKVKVYESYMNKLLKTNREKWMDEVEFP